MLLMVTGQNDLHIVPVDDQFTVSAAMKLLTHK